MVPRGYGKYKNPKTRKCPNTQTQTYVVNQHFFLAQQPGVEHPMEFDWDNYKRNEFLKAQGFKPPKATSTGTTIVGMVYKDGVVLGADTRATEGPIVADKNCEKIHYLANSIYCCGAGTAADTEFTTGMVSSKLAIHRLNSRREPRVATAVTFLKQYLFRYQGHIGAALIVGGVDATGPQLFSVYPHGSVDRLPFVTMGSGSLAAVSILESGYRPDMSREEAAALVAQAIKAGIFNDLGSGSNVDLVVIAKQETEVLRNYMMPNERPEKELQYRFPKGTTRILSEKILPLGELAMEII